ncbi:MAG: threonine-phosphate decarboxylase CobD [Candidatus Loosdrechtia sp.]|uniref:pyridoxal phosphate-dependent aminotransferase n=1 Tax=Candidatus Loosdrechtia sp. TaxID=3101272 RepID=UPI003A6E3563|nr:MAG: threonine-phosphate decarboxylase CobD [Candidatus Jettenia sp. AMX2]
MFKGHGGNIRHLPSDIKTGRKKDDILDFSASINPLGYPENVRRVIQEKLDDILHYPDIDCSHLRQHIAQEIGRSCDEIIIGNGSTELFYLIPRALRPEKGVVFNPTFSEFAEALKCSHAEVIHNVLKEENQFRFVYSKEYFSDGKSGIAFLCNPNNPTGQLVERHSILDMARQHPGITFVIDEAFMDFVEYPGKYSVIKDAGIVCNVIVVRSLTKFYGFPGLRVGYMVTSKDLAGKIMQYKEPWSVNALAQSAAVAALKDKVFISQSREFMLKERAYLFNELSHIRGLFPYLPAANYILAKIAVTGMTSSFLYERLLTSGIAIRDCSNFIGLNDTYFRVAVRTREENRKLIDQLSNVMNQFPGGENCQIRNGLLQSRKERKGFRFKD